MNKTKGLINMKRILVICTAFMLVFALNSCKQEKNRAHSENIQQKNEDQSILIREDSKNNGETEIKNNEIYSGIWTTDGHPASMIYTKTGGEILEIKIEENHIKGSYVCVQETNFRIASIDNIETEIISGVADFDFEDDGWGNSGKIKFIFEEDKIIVEVIQLIINSDNATGMSVSGSILLRENIGIISINDNSENDNIEQRIIDTSIYRNGNKYWEEVESWDEKNGRTGLDRPIEPLLYGETQDYKKEELKEYPKVILYLAKNEIYAKHGYIFSDKELQNYFLGQVWYIPEIDSLEFNDNAFNEHELNNLNLLLDLLDE